MAIQFAKATKRRSKLRLGLCGPAGSGKTMSALMVARGLAGPTGRIAVIDTERGSASLYAEETPFDVVELESFAPDHYVEAIKTAEDLGYGVIVIDSLSHAWEGKDGALDMKDRAAQRPGVNDWTAWRFVTPAHNRLIEAMLQSKTHVIATMRTKMDYVQETDANGKKVVRKLGMAPIQRPGMDYEFTVTGDLDYEHVLTIGKTRCKLVDRQQFPMPGERFAKILLGWLESGAAEVAPEVKNGAAAPVAQESGTGQQQEVREMGTSPGAPEAGTKPASPDYAAKIANATTEKELHDVAIEIKKAKVSGPARDALLAAHAKRKAQLTQKAAAA